MRISLPVPSFSSFTPPVEIKSLATPGLSFGDFLLSRGQFDLTAWESINLFASCTPFFNAVDMRAEAFSSLPVRVFDRKSRTFINDHPILELFQAKANAMQTGPDWLREYSSYLDITGNAFPVATGINPNKPPLELQMLQPQFISLLVSKLYGSFGYTGQILYNNSGGGISYDLKEVDGVFRYFNEDGTAEAMHSHTFNPYRSQTNLWGLSKATPLWLQLQQFIAADRNNYSVLERGGRPSLAWVWQHDEPMTDEQFERWRSEVQSYKGAINAGRQVVVDNIKPEVISNSNKDMEFSLNRKTVMMDIYNAYHIPLAMIAPDTMTMDNLRVAQIMLYMRSIFPHADNIFADLTKFLMHRYSGSKTLMITYNQADIPVLQDLMVEQTINKSKLNVLTDNELRTMLGQESLGEPGDRVWKPARYLPTDMIDQMTTDNLTQPARGNSPGPRQGIGDKSDMQNFVKQLASMKTSNGKEWVYNEHEIQIKAYDLFNDHVSLGAISDIRYEISDTDE